MPYASFPPNIRSASDPWAQDSDNASISSTSSRPRSKRGVKLKFYAASEDSSSTISSCVQTFSSSEQTNPLHGQKKETLFMTMNELLAMATESLLLLKKLQSDILDEAQKGHGDNVATFTCKACGKICSLENVNYKNSCCIAFMAGVHAGLEVYRDGKKLWQTQGQGRSKLKRLGVDHVQSLYTDPCGYAKNMETWLLDYMESMWSSPKSISRVTVASVTKIEAQRPRIRELMTRFRISAALLRRLIEKSAQKDLSLARSKVSVPDPTRLVFTTVPDLRSGQILLVRGCTHVLEMT